MNFSPLPHLGYSHFYHYPISTSPSFTHTAAFETKGHTLMCTLIRNSMDFTMSESPNSPDEDEPLIQLSQSRQLLAQSAGCLPRDHCLKPKFEELMGDLEAAILKMKKGLAGSRQTRTGSAFIDTPPADSKDPSSLSPNMARPKLERRPMSDFFPKVEKTPPLTGFTPQKDREIQKAGRRKRSRSHSHNSRPRRVDKRHKPALTAGQKVLRNIRKARTKMFDEGGI